MPHRASSFDGHPGPRTDSRPRLNAQDIVWGRPIFHAPELPNPQVIHDPLPFRTQHFTAQRPTNGR